LPPTAKGRRPAIPLRQLRARFQQEAKPCAGHGFSDQEVEWIPPSDFSVTDTVEMKPHVPRELAGATAWHSLLYQGCATGNGPGNRRGETTEMTKALQANSETFRVAELPSRADQLNR